MAARRQTQKGPPELFVAASLRYFCAVRARVGSESSVRGFDDELFLADHAKLRLREASSPWLSPEIPPNTGQRRGGCFAAAATRPWAPALPDGPMSRSSPPLARWMGARSCCCPISRST